MTEFGILDTSQVDQGFVRTRDQIISAVHGGKHHSFCTVDVHVTHFGKLERVNDRNRTWRGYRLSESPDAPDEQPIDPLVVRCVPCLLANSRRKLLVVEILATRRCHNTNLGGALDPACLERRHCAVRQSRPVEHDGSGHRCRRQLVVAIFEIGSTPDSLITTRLADAQSNGRSTE